MNVLIEDLRVNTTRIFIDGKRYILPSKRPIYLSVSERALESLSKLPFIKIHTDLKDKPIKDQKDVEEAKDQYPIDQKDSNPIEDQDINKDPIDQEDSTPIKDSDSIRDQEESKDQDPTDLSLLSKKELKALVEKSGHPTAGMTKSNLIDWLKENPHVLSL